jgi:alpha-D-xyloside xylohydrolase
MEQMRVAHAEGLPPMRPAFVDFPDDPRSWAAEDTFMFGPSLLVAPVTHYRARDRQVYLPAGSRWTDPWTATEYEGGQDVTVAAPLDRIPLFLRDDAALPLMPPG